MGFGEGVRLVASGEVSCGGGRRCGRFCERDFSILLVEAKNSADASAGPAAAMRPCLQSCSWIEGPV
eukprot:6039384-Pleurochrysis_carterae.AAC.1